MWFSTSYYSAPSCDSLSRQQIRTYNDRQVYSLASYRFLILYLYDSKKEKRGFRNLEVPIRHHCISPRLEWCPQIGWWTPWWDGRTNGSSITSRHTVISRIFIAILSVESPHPLCGSVAIHRGTSSFIAMFQSWI